MLALALVRFFLLKPNVIDLVSFFLSLSFSVYSVYSQVCLHRVGFCQNNSGSWYFVQHTLNTTGKSSKSSVSFCPCYITIRLLGLIYQFQSVTVLTCTHFGISVLTLVSSVIAFIRDVNIGFGRHFCNNVRSPSFTGRHRK